MPLDEPSLRTPGFTEGIRVKLADGQEWTFPRPWLRFYPKRDTGGRIYMDGGDSYGPEFEDKYDELVELLGDDSAAYEQHCLLLELASMLLLSNYDLTDRQLRRVLTIDESNPECRAMWEDINGVLNRSPKKASPDGSG